MLLPSFIKSFVERLFFFDSYGSSLEQYISSHNPQNSGDVERLEKEYTEKKVKGLL